MSGVETDILNKTKGRCDQAEIYSLDEIMTLIGFESNRLKSTDILENVGIALRLIKDGRMGEGYATDLSEKGQNLLVNKVETLARMGSKVKFNFPEASQYPCLRLDQNCVHAFTTEQLVDAGERIMKIILKAIPDVMAFLTFGKTRTSVRLINTNGVDIEYKRSVSSYGVGLNLIEGKNVIQVYGVDRSLKQIKEFEQTADKVIEDTILARNTSTLSGGKYPAIFIPSSLGDVFMSFMDGINGKVVAKGVSPLIGKIGQSILDERITIIDDCQHEQGLFSSPVDDEGIRGQKTMIVEKGVLKNYITDLNSAEQLGLQCTGNGFRALPFEHTRHYRTPVEVCISNLILEPGNISYEDMLKEIKTGIEVHHITGILLGNLTNGDFSGNLELAYKIQNGKRVGRIRDTMISGNFYQLFKNNILGIGNSQVWTGFFGGSSGSMLLPHVLLKDVELSGKH